MFFNLFLIYFLNLTNTTTGLRLKAGTKNNYCDLDESVAIRGLELVGL